MQIRSVGSQWLKEHYHLSRHIILHCSYVGDNESLELTSKGNIKQVYGIKYSPKEDIPLMHLEFSLKYDTPNLDFIKAVLIKISINDIIVFIENSPYGKYARKIGFLYEFLIGTELKLTKKISGNYIDLLQDEEYITSSGVKNKRWRINDNLLGTHAFCPIVRKTNELNNLLAQNISQKIEQLKDNFSPEIFRRASNYLYRKETRSSYEIEKETPSPDRMEKFIALLMQAGTEQPDQQLDEHQLVQLQNAIVDKRFAAAGFRDFQNYIGQSLLGGHDMIHYICPPPTILLSLMQGLKETALKAAGINPEIKAAILAFGFVFIHPFEDGNGRLHRFLIHDILVRDGIVPQGLIIPVSARMLNHIKDYDLILEVYSKPLMQFITYEKNADGGVVITNPEETESYFRYPDLTDHCIYLTQTIHATIKEDMPEELIFIQRYDEVKKELQRIVDMPDKELDLMIMFLHQNKGVFPKRRREQFIKLIDEEISRMQLAFRKVFELDIN